MFDACTKMSFHDCPIRLGLRKIKSDLQVVHGASGNNRNIAVVVTTSCNNNLPRLLKFDTCSKGFPLFDLNQMLHVCNSY